jgi:hypothetical protein
LAAFRVAELAAAQAETLDVCHIDATTPRPRTAVLEASEVADMNNMEV